MLRANIHNNAQRVYKLSFPFLLGALVMTILPLSCAPKRPAEPEPMVRVIEHRLGNTPLKISVVFGTRKRDHLFVQLHDNEETAERTARAVMDQTGGSFLRIVNNNRRYVSFSMGGSRYEFDPNRIFTAAGRAATLKERGRYSAAAEAEVKKFSELLLEQLNNYNYVIALHNNSNNSYTIHHYRDQRKGDAAAVHINPSMDRDDFIFTTDASIYRFTSSKNINSVLQNNREAKDDGSLSVYCGRNNLPYVNIETQHGHQRQQLELALAVMEKIN